ncbi:MAG: hypothetical protein EOP83_20570 [Verrucomicrobiaceae bacterium]|nr:MAG: hypothetical protein EOP83_20570 [Verrucomicrobiaceae bacterium]
MRRIIGLVEAEQPLNELRGIRGDVEGAKDLDSKHGVIAYMEEKGFTTLGYGMWGAVFDHPQFQGRYVLKLFADKFYEMFINYCQAQPSNPYLPKFVGKIIRVNADARLVRIERLEPLTGTDDEFQDALDRIGTYLLIKNPKPSVAQRIERIADEYNIAHLIPTMRDLAQKLPAGAAYDVHTENMMLRDGKTVITDPWAGAEIPFLK